LLLLCELPRAASTASQLELGSFGVELVASSFYYIELVELLLHCMLLVLRMLLFRVLFHAVSLPGRATALLLRCFVLLHLSPA
jgi:hypothetical protein